MQAIIIDDEVLAQETLRKLLREVAPMLEIVDVVSSVAEAVKSINRNKPDIVFSDIDMPGITGLQLLEFFNEEDIQFELIYVTSYSDFAVRAFQLSAIDYLLKPLEKELLEKAIKKVEKKLNFGQSERNLALKASIANNSFEKIALPLSDGVLFVEMKDILVMKADNVYTEVELANGKRIVVSKPLKSFEKLLTEQMSFFRIHRSYLVNLKGIKQFIKSDGGTAIMENETQVPIARDRKDSFIKAWEKIRVR